MQPFGISARGLCRQFVGDVEILLSKACFLSLPLAMVVGSYPFQYWDHVQSYGCPSLQRVTILNPNFRCTEVSRA